MNLYRCTFISKPHIFSLLQCQSYHRILHLSTLIFQSLIGWLQTAGFPLAYISKYLVSIPYRLATNVSFGDEWNIEVEVSIPYRLATNYALKDKLIPERKSVSIPYRLATNKNEEREQGNKETSFNPL